jgi:hypothetical protein
VDKVLLKGFEESEPIDIYTIDLDFGGQQGSNTTDNLLKASFIGGVNNPSQGEWHESYASSMLNGGNKSNIQEDIRNE